MVGGAFPPRMCKSRCCFRCKRVRQIDAQSKQDYPSFGPCLTDLQIGQEADFLTAPLRPLVWRLRLVSLARQERCRRFAYRLPRLHSAEPNKYPLTRLPNIGIIEIPTQVHEKSSVNI